MEGREGPRGAPGLGEVGEKVEALAPVEPEAPGDRAAVVSLIMVGFATQRSGPPCKSKIRMFCPKVENISPARQFRITLA